jgi:hypothetical protein
VQKKIKRILYQFAVDDIVRTIWFVSWSYICYGERSLLGFLNVGSVILFFMWVNRVSKCMNTIVTNIVSWFPLQLFFTWKYITVLSAFRNSNKVREIMSGKTIFCVIPCFF